MNKLNQIEIDHLKKTVQFTNMPVHDLTWIKAFQLHGQKEKPLSMHCRPCYAKVLEWNIKNSK